MALLHVLQYPDDRLHIVARPVTRFDDRLRTLVRDMAQTMYAAPGVGLAATQVDVHERLIVIDVSDTHDALQVFINPEIIARSGEEQYEQEGCLSVPDVYEKVKRSSRITVRAQDAEGRSFELEAEGMLAVCIQHEMDHLDGKVFVEYLSPLKQSRILTRIGKLRRRQHVNA